MRHRETRKTPLNAALASCRRAFVAVGVLSLVINLLMLTGPIFMLQVYDRVLTSGSVPTLVALGVLVVVLYGFMATFDAIRARMLVRIGQRVDAQLSGQAFSSAVMLPIMAGRRGERLEPVSDLDRVRQFFSSAGPTALFDLPWMPVYLLIVFLLHPWLGLVGLIGAITIGALATANEFLSRAPAADLARRSVQRNAAVDASRANGEAVVAMGMLDNLQRTWIEGNRDYLRTNLIAADMGSGSSALIRAIRFTLQSAVLGVGAYLAIEHEITPGLMIAASIITARALAPVEQAVGNWRGFLAARQSIARLQTALAVVPDEARATELPPPHERLETAGLSVAPPGEKMPVLRGLSFGLAAGDGLGVIGPSGSGKSSLARTLVGVWQPMQGAVRLDGADLAQWDRQRLGRSIGYLPQDIELFDGTVAQNIGRFDADATSDEVIAAARLANAHDLITGLANGYETLVGERGATLSGGQQQRIGLARALFRMPFLVVLDEPNSNLDAEGERALTDAIRHVREAGSIVVVIAHRPSAVAALDKLLRLEAGRAVDFGAKADVIKRLEQEAQARGASLKVVPDAR